MKKTILLTIFMMVFGVVFAQKSAGIAFDKMIHDFGTFSETDKTVTTTFTFKNTGKTPLVINRVVASCGCTLPEWTKEPIAPGKSGFVKATYNAVGRPGAFSKTITVFTNTAERNISLNIKGVVEPAKE
ncbi:MAG: DUF1573 domain-containing protein [Bacteroidales bacterium]